MASESLKKAFDYLEKGFMTIDEYIQKTENKVIMKKPQFADDQQFSNDYPEHPMASINRFTRIKGADMIRDYKGVYLDSEINQICKYLFDCCATVRLSLVQALLNAENLNSIEYIKKLLKKEEEIKIYKMSSKSVRNFANIAIIKLEKPELQSIKLGMRTYLGEIKNDQANGYGIIYYDGLGNFIYEGDFKDGKFDGYGTLYNDNGTIKHQGQFKDGKFIS